MITTMKSHISATKGSVHCLICTRTVDADIVRAGRKLFVKSGQKCPRCGSCLDAGYVVRLNEAA